MQKLTIDEAIEMVTNEYEKAVRFNESSVKQDAGFAVHNPVAWALYKAWRIADGKEPLAAREAHDEQT